MIRLVALLVMAMVMALGGAALSGCDKKVEQSGKSEAHADQAAPFDPELRQELDRYPLTTCVVMPAEPLGPRTVNYMHHSRLIRFCCADCIPRFQAEPERYLALLDAAK